MFETGEEAVAHVFAGLLGEFHDGLADLLHLLLLVDLEVFERGQVGDAHLLGVEVEEAQLLQVLRVLSLRQQHLALALMLYQHGVQQEELLLQDLLADVGLVLGHVGAPHLERLPLPELGEERQPLDVVVVVALLDPLLHRHEVRGLPRVEQAEPLLAMHSAFNQRAYLSV